MVRVPLQELQQEGGLPTVHLRLTPVWPDTNVSPKSCNAQSEPPDGIAITMRLKLPRSRIGAGIPLLTLPLKMGPTPSARYDGDALHASDSKGRLPLSYTDEDPEFGPRSWFADREPLGEEISFEFYAPARKTDKNTLLGPRVDLRKDRGGGLVGQGIGFIPSPPPPRNHNSDGTREGTSGISDPWEITVEWDFDQAPNGTKGAWSYGDAMSITVVDSPERAIAHGVFAVGSLQRYPSWDVDLASTSERVYAVYWLDPAPWDMVSLSKQTKEIYERIATYFRSQDPFRVFFRQIENGAGGTGATYSFVLEYSAPSVPQMTPHEMADLLAHETVHEYALMEPETGEEEAWYVEGVASYVGALVGLPRRDMIRSLNNYAQAYYTSPTVRLDYRYVLDHYWENMHLTRVPYFRGVMYLALVNGWMLEETGRRCSLDVIIDRLYQLRLEGKPCGTKDFNDILGEFVDKRSVGEAFESMLRGDLIIPGEDCFAEHGLKLVRRDMEKFELGFDPNSMRTSRVKGLVKGSNAEKAGVREDDEIVIGYQVWSVADAMENVMQLTVKRPWGEQTLKWWPRGEKVEAYMWVETHPETCKESL